MGARNRTTPRPWTPMPKVKDVYTYQGVGPTADINPLTPLNALKPERNLNGCHFVNCDRVVFNDECVDACPKLYSPIENNCGVNICQIQMRYSIIFGMAALLSMFILVTLVCLPLAIKLQRRKNRYEIYKPVNIHVEPASCSVPSLMRQPNSPIHTLVPHFGDDQSDTDRSTSMLIEPSVEPQLTTAQKMIDQFMDNFHAVVHDTPHRNSMLPTNYSNSNFTIGLFNHEGGYLELSHLQITMYIPPGAIPFNEKRQVFMYVSYHNEDLPALKGSMSPMGPVIYCGEHGQKFLSHVIITYPEVDMNCIDSELWQYRLMRTDTSHNSVSKWIDATSDVDTQTFVLGQQRVLLVDHFTGYQISAEAGSSKATKQMKLGVFGDKLYAGDPVYDLKVRIYNDGTPQHDLPLDDIRCIDVINNNQPLCIKVKDIGPGWKMDETEQEISFEHVWKSQSESCTFRSSQYGGSSVPFYCSVEVFQKRTTEANSKRLLRPMAKVSEKILEVNHVPVQHNQLTEPKTPEAAFYELELSPATRQDTGLPLVMQQRLAVTLDPTHPEGKDWTLLAEKIGLSHDIIRWINERKKSPTMCVLDIAAAMYKGRVQRFLSQSFSVMGHEVCGQIVEECSTQNRWSISSNGQGGLSRDSTTSDVTTKLFQMKMEQKSRQSNPQVKSFASESGYSSQSQYSKFSSQPNIQSPVSRIDVTQASWGDVSNEGLDYDNVLSPTDQPPRHVMSQSVPCIPGFGVQATMNIPPRDATTLSSVSETDSQQTVLATCSENTLLGDNRDTKSLPRTPSPKILERTTERNCASPVMNAYPTHSDGDLTFSTFRRNRPKKLNLEKSRPNSVDSGTWLSPCHVHLSPGHVCAMDPTIQQGDDSHGSIQLLSDHGDSSFRIVTPNVKDLP
ncbi:unnamed protein product [Owenia fusiformis]|uniref:Netrin receptor UNC5 n=1 Tax=Owenia fusiformis TaxID=6347 RepID=A0A8J1U3M5_OWEFU|nr:unnamed protein product [Owenia fusiformis]